MDVCRERLITALSCDLCPALGQLCGRSAKDTWSEQFLPGSSAHNVHDIAAVVWPSSRPETITLCCLGSGCWQGGTSLGVRTMSLWYYPLTTQHGSAVWVRVKHIVCLTLLDAQFQSDGDLSLSPPPPLTLYPSFSSSRSALRTTRQRYPERAVSPGPSTISQLCLGKRLSGLSLRPETIIVALLPRIWTLAWRNSLVVRTRKSVSLWCYRTIHPSGSPTMEWGGIILPAKREAISHYNHWCT
ncbi:hypothetical protein C8R44DRAFT_772496 [Mycena epipterygia]|nr:hypothetical protein C8R44DRAFT_772496 [Mycena epipterygia]